MSDGTPQRDYPDHDMQPAHDVQPTPVHQPTQSGPQADPSAGDVTPKEKKNKEETTDGEKAMVFLSSAKRKIKGGETELLYSAPISDRIVLSHFLWFQMFPCSFALCHSAALKESTYVHLYEDRVEWNYPTSCCSTIYDNQGIVYLDRSITESQTVPSCCDPFCTHNSIAPTCWDAFGTSVMLSGENSCFWIKGTNSWGIPIMNTPAAFACCCPSPFCGKPLPCLNKEWMFFHFLESQELKFRIRAQRQKLIEAGHACAAPQPQM